MTLGDDDDDDDDDDDNDNDNDNGNMDPIANANSPSGSMGGIGPLPGEPRKIIPIPRRKPVESTGLGKTTLCSQFRDNMETLLDILIDDTLDDAEFEKVQRIIKTDPGNYMSHLAFVNDIGFYGQWGNQGQRVLNYTVGTLDRSKGRQSLNLLSILLGERPEVAMGFIRKAFGGFTLEQRRMMATPRKLSARRRKQTMSTTCRFQTLNEIVTWPEFWGLRLWPDLASNLLLYNRFELAQEIMDLLGMPQVHWWTFIIKRAHWALFMDQEAAVTTMMDPVDCESVKPVKSMKQAEQERLTKLRGLCYTLKTAIGDKQLVNVFAKYDDISALYPILGLPEDFIFPEDDDMGDLFVSYADGARH
ncbi:hypothetical protein BJ085DRAFT_29318 [Dimargaris cristalligena]|uniref:Uncharacterized protein n=1 Tax=Dimargaris cristalligena TaxID=215637 RepID=A0A4P9ZXI9_9FUNG|nr:hypothetical protein BJ085DRAFT_29318 [Dimargaris cristalligena]|eukprot:RKP38098.1 hypothetical protein BJ085DRAFT_29318 [Dimargaris cristalligena]